MAERDQISIEPDHLGVGPDLRAIQGRARIRIDLEAALAEFSAIAASLRPVTEEQEA